MSEQITHLQSKAFEGCELPLPGKISGKVRDSYPLGNGQRLLVTTDRLSAFDRNLALVQYKGQVLNQLSAWWFEQTSEIIPNHVASLPDPNALVAKSVSFSRPVVFDYVATPQALAARAARLWAALADGTLKAPPVERHALAAAADAHARLESRATTGALVLLA